MTDEDQRLEIPRGLSNPWKFVQKRIIFENKIQMTDAVTRYHKVYARDKENDALLQEAIVSMRQLYLEIKEIVKKNRKSKRDCKETILYMDELLSDPKRDFSSEDFQNLYTHSCSQYQ
jgi:hypothetical protein